MLWDIIICFSQFLHNKIMKQLSKSISSPSRTDLFPPPLMSFIRADAGNRSKSSRSRSSPIFVRKKNVDFETQEPSSPKVTCMGQVRTNKRSSNKTTPAVRCRWIRSVLSFNRCHCRTFWNRSAMLFRGKREIRRTSESRVGNEVEDSEKDEEDDDGRDRDAVVASPSVPSPPKNALILTRCRSAPNRSSFNGNRYRSSSITRDGTVEEEEKTECGYGNNVASKIELRNSERMLKKLESSKGDGDSKSVNGSRNQILTRSKSEPARIGEKLYGELNLHEEERWVMNKKNSYILNNL